MFFPHSSSCASKSSVRSVQAQQETQKAALSYERAVSMHTAAREMVYVAEQGLMADGKNTLDPTWQEMLNHATSKVTMGPGVTAALYLWLSFSLRACVENESFTSEGLFLGFEGG